MWFQLLFDSLRPRKLRERSRRGQRSGARSRRQARRLLVEGLEARQLLTFLPAADFAVDTNPQAVVTGDFNGDGHLDLATANPVADTVSVLLGGGAGGFGDAIDTAVIIYGVEDGVSVFLTAADFNNDGKDDLAVDRRVLLSSGDGTFAPSGASSYSWFPVAAGDFNNDGNIDLVYSEPAWSGSGEVGGEYIRVLPGDGQGGFGQARTSYYADESAWPGSLTVGDLNGDGNLDVVSLSGDYSPGGRVFLGGGTGTFTGSPLDMSGYAAAVAIGDFTADGIPDIIHVSRYGEDLVSVHPGHGDGTFGFQLCVGRCYFDYGTLSGMAVADFDGDGRLEAVVSDSVAGTVTELPGDALIYTVGSSPAAIVVGDFNGDGRPDVATANAGSNTVSVLLNDGTWTPLPPPPPPPPPPPSLRVWDAPVVTEGNVGASAATFTVTLSAASTDTVTVAYATASGTATAGSDYQFVSGTLTIPAGQTTGTITVLANGDRLAELNETFIVNLSGATNATIADGQGIGTIVDDEPRISISDVTKKEGRRNQTTLFTFVITLSAAYDHPVTMSYQTVNGTATTGNGDYIAKTGTLTFAPGETTKTITIEVKGDSKREANETFYLDLFGNSSNSQFTKNRGLGTILNDD